MTNSSSTDLKYTLASDIAKLELVFEAAKEGYFCMTPQGHIRLFNKRFYRDFDIDPDSDTGFDNWLSLVWEEDRQMLTDAVTLQKYDKQDVVISQYRIRNRKNECVWIEALGKLVLDDNGEVDVIVGYHADITERKRREDSVKQLAYWDSLTGLYNRNKMVEAIEHRIHDQRSAHLLYIDLEQFRSVNNILGFEVGDQVLVHISNMILEILPPQALLARHYGAEFVVLLDNNQAEVVHETAQIILSKIQSPIWIMDKYLSLDAKMCVYPISDFSLSGDQVIQKAQMILSAMKETSSESILYYNTQVEAHYMRQLNIERFMKSSLSKREFSLNYQPIFDMKTDLIEGFEALLRWHNPILGQVFPDEFIPIAEKNLLIYELGQFVLHESCRFLKQLNVQGFFPYMSVNVSAVQLNQPAFSEQVLSIIDSFNIQRHQIVLEVTESVTLDGSEHKREVLKYLKEQGVQLAIDDFGTGYSSINSIISLPINYLKIDKSLVQQANTSSDSLALIELLAAFTNRAHYHIVAEGVETKAIQETLRSIGITLGQGYLFSRPLSEADALALLMQRL